MSTKDLLMLLLIRIMEGMKDGKVSNKEDLPEEILDELYIIACKVCSPEYMDYLIQVKQKSKIGTLRQ